MGEGATGAVGRWGDGVGFTEESKAYWMIAGVLLRIIKYTFIFKATLMCFEIFSILYCTSKCH